jgi:xanthine dehydrogenase small subunit
MIRFLLNETLCQVDDVAPSLSVLQYLRTKATLTGSKEGCGAGDCGACTVAIGELQAGTVAYKTINTCITPVGTLHGKHLITVEGLAKAGRLHPVQQALIDCHGSQCGFCTPGIIMSLFVWWQNAQMDRSLHNRQAVEIALSGNLCRCTGYQPIFNAALQALTLSQPEFWHHNVAVIQTQLEEIHQQGSGSLNTVSTRFLIPTSREELLAQRQEFPAAQLVAGATDLALEFTQQLKTPTTLIYLGNIAELQNCTDSADALVIGAAVTYQTLTPYLTRYFPSFADLMLRLGSAQIRNQGTLAGNVANASPIGDTPPVLLAVAAKLKLRSNHGERVIPIDDFFIAYRQTALQPGEFIESIEIPKLQPDQILKVYKISKRFDDDISAVCLGLFMQISDGIICKVRLGFGGMAAIPKRAINTEHALIGKAFDEHSLAAAQAALAQDFTPIDDVRASGKYRLAVAANLLTRALLEMRGEDTSLHHESNSQEVVRYA